MHYCIDMICYLFQDLEITDLMIHVHDMDTSIFSTNYKTFYFSTGMNKFTISYV